MGASGHLFSPGSFGKRTYLQDGIAFSHCAFSKRTWREKVQREALAHALARRHILIRVDPRKSVVKRFLVLPTPSNDMAFGRRISNYFSIHLYNVQLIWTALTVNSPEGQLGVKSKGETRP